MELLFFPHVYLHSLHFCILACRWQYGPIFQNMARIDSSAVAIDGSGGGFDGNK